LAYGGAAHPPGVVTAPITEKHIIGLLGSHNELDTLANANTSSTGYPAIRPTAPPDVRQTIGHLLVLTTAGSQAHCQEKDCEANAQGREGQDIHRAAVAA